MYAGAAEELLHFFFCVCKKKRMVMIPERYAREVNEAIQNLLNAHFREGNDDIQQLAGLLNSIIPEADFKRLHDEMGLLIDKEKGPSAEYIFGKSPYKLQ